MTNFMSVAYVHNRYRYKYNNNLHKARLGGVKIWQFWSRCTSVSSQLFVVYQCSGIDTHVHVYVGLLDDLNSECQPSAVTLNINIFVTLL